jgi:hypothetical protein
MKQFVASAALLYAFQVGAITSLALSLISTAGLTSGEVIESIGPTSAPAWTAVTLSGLGGLAKAYDLSDVASATTSLANLGGLSTTTAASTYLTQTSAASTYLFQSSAATTYGAKTSPLSQFAATTSAQLSGVTSDETGTGVLVYNISHALVSPSITRFRRHCGSKWTASRLDRLHTYWHCISGNIHVSQCDLSNFYEREAHVRSCCGNDNDRGNGNDDSRITSRHERDREWR